MRARILSDERGLTLIELLVAAAMSVVIVGAGGSMLISAVRSQPQLNERNQKVTEVRWVQERMTKELRNGVRVDEATASTVSFVTRVRTSTCGSSGSLDSDAPAINCQVTYDCASGTCTRAEAPEGVVGSGTPTQLIDDLESGAVFNYFPNKEEPTYVGIVLRVPNPSGSGALTVSDGASLRTPVLLSSG
ncbi:MAG TPA: type II secretion system protein [Solirubrobacterales bacterium]